jgi:CRISPR-associated protein (TIGR03984 family)
MKNNGLELKKIKSVTEYKDYSIDTIESDISKKITNDSFVLAFLVNEVLIGKFRAGKIVFPLGKKLEAKYLQKLRIFNNDEELFIWKSGEKLKSRYRKDSEGEDTISIDAFQVLFGTETENTIDGTIIKEDRGTSIELLLKVDAMNADKPADRVKIHTRNYLELRSDGQYQYIDSRLIGFTFGKNNKEQGGK